MVYHLALLVSDHYPVYLATGNADFIGSGLLLVPGSEQDVCLVGLHFGYLPRVFS